MFAVYQGQLYTYQTIVSVYSILYAALFYIYFIMVGINTKPLSKVAIELENRVADMAMPEAIPHYLQLAEYYHWINGRKQKQFLDKILAYVNLDSKDVNHILARIQLIGCYINIMELAYADQLALQVLKDAEANGDEELVIMAKQASCLAAVYNGRHQDAEQYITDCLLYAKHIEDVGLKGRIYTTAAFFNLDKDHTAATQYGMLAYENAKHSNEPWRVGSALLTLGYIAWNNEDKEATLNYFSEASELLKQQGATEYYATCVLQISKSFKDLHRYNEALVQLGIAESLYKEIGISRHIIGVYSTYARMYRAMKEYDKGIAYYYKAIELAKKDGNTYEEGATYGLLAQMYIDMDKVDEAVQCFEKAKVLLESSNRTTNSMAIVKYLHQLYKRQGNADKAYDALLSYTDMRFKLQDEVRIKEVVALQEKYEAGKREAELQHIKLQQAESELKALKAQMNPHFVFNALNSIQEVFFLGDKRLANKHLARFSTLIRNILQLSGQASVLLHEEVNMLQEYLSLEALRFGDSFSYTIDIDDAVDVYNLDVPPMIMQPFVENAIKHGLMHKEGAQMLHLNIRYDEPSNTLHICVADNGVGRKASADINQYRQGHQSFATTALQKRFEYLNMNSNLQYGFEYVDLYDAEQNAIGTEVHISIPVKN